MFIEELLPSIPLENREAEFVGMIEQGQDSTGNSRKLGWLETIAAFSNTAGGTLYVGVDNRTHELLPLPRSEADKTILLVQQQIRERIVPAISCDIRALAVPETKPAQCILAIRVRKNREIPVAVRESGLFGIYVRNFGQTVLATSDQIRDLILLSDGQPYDAMPSEEIFAEEHFSKLFSACSERGVRLTEKALMAKGFMDPEFRLSKGALLFADACRDIQRTRIVATLWPGIDKGSSTILSSDEYSGNLLGAIDFCLNFVQTRSVNGFRKTAGGREPLVAYPARSVLEGVVNAIAHRNYFIQGAQIELNLFSDRLEITSPGALLGVRELRRETNIAAILPRRRNEVICAILEMCRYLDDKGPGLDKIEDDYRPYGEDMRPYVTADSSGFTLALPNLTARNSPIAIGAAEAPAPVIADGMLSGKHDKAILSYCMAEPREVKEIAGHLGLRVSTYLRNTMLQLLVDKGLLIKSTRAGVSVYTTNREKIQLSDCELSTKLRPAGRPGKRSCRK